MSGPTLPDAAASYSGSAGAVASRAGRPLPRFITLKRWWIAPALLALSLAGGWIYLLAATPLYIASAILATGYGAGATGLIAPDEFLTAQRETILSPAVLSAGTRAAPAISELRRAISVRTSKGDGTIVISVEWPEPAPAATATNAIAEAYLDAYRASQRRASQTLTDLTAQRDALKLQRADAEKALADAREQAGSAGEGAASAAARVEQLEAALAAARDQAQRAASAAAAAEQVIQTDPARAAGLVEAARPSGIFVELDQQRNQLADELRSAEALFERQRQTMLERHPVRRATEQKINELRTRRDALDGDYFKAYQAHLDRQRTTAEQKVTEIEALLADQHARVGEGTDASARLGELEASLARADTALTAAEQALWNAMWNAGADGPEITLAQPAQPPRRPASPKPPRVMLVALVIGLGAGMLAAIVGSRFR